MHKTINQLKKLFVLIKIRKMMAKKLVTYETRTTDPKTIRCLSVTVTANTATKHCWQTSF